LSDNALADQIAKRYIARRDVKAVQHKDGSWSPHTKSGKHDGERIPWGRADLNAHLAGSSTFGHYLLDTDSTTKLFAFDIDLEQWKPTEPDRKFYYPEGWGKDPLEEKDSPDYPSYAPLLFDPRLAWQDRRHPSRSWLKYQMKMIAHELTVVIERDLELPCAVAYSGGKGVHVYGFCGKVPAAEAIEGAHIVLDTLGHWRASRGTNFYKDTNEDVLRGFQNFCIEVFPKQTTMTDDSLGNLMRLPLGRNMKSTDPTFFIDMTSPMGVMAPVDPMHALAGNPWKRYGE